jgi:hypothetical protein
MPDRDYVVLIGNLRDRWGHREEPAMPGLLSRQWWSDARHYQIAALSALLAFNFGWLDFGARPLNSALAVVGALATRALCTRWFALPGGK